jgi:MFS family permease
VLHTPDPRRWWALALLCGAFFMVLLDGTIVLVALPSIGADLSFSEQGLQWVLSAYALTAQQVLGYSAFKFGVSSVVLAVGATAGAIAGQAAVLKAGFRWVAATGLALMGAGSLVLTQVSVHGGYFPDIFLGLLLCGLGIGLAFVTATVAALAGVTEHEAGLASASATSPCRSAQRSASPSSRPWPSPARQTTWQRTKVRTRSSC